MTFLWGLNVKKMRAQGDSFVNVSTCGAYTEPRGPLRQVKSPFIKTKQKTKPARLESACLPLGCAVRGHFPQGPQGRTPVGSGHPEGGSSMRVAHAGARGTGCSARKGGTRSPEGRAALNDSAAPAQGADTLRRGRNSRWTPHAASARPCGGTRTQPPHVPGPRGPRGPRGRPRPSAGRCPAGRLTGPALGMKPRGVLAGRSLPQLQPGRGPRVGPRLAWPPEAAGAVTRGGPRPCCKARPRRGAVAVPRGAVCGAGGVPTRALPRGGRQRLEPRG